MKVIELHSRIACPRLYARLVWQELFNIYRANDGSLEEMDSLLCDYSILIREFEKFENFQLAWECNGWYTSLTPLAGYVNMVWPGCEIYYYHSAKKIEILQTRVKV